MTSFEQQQLNEFIGKCVINNYSFPGVRVGTSNITIQELYHNYSVKALNDYADVLERSNKRTSRNDKSSEKKVYNTDITYSEFVSVIDIIVKDKEQKEAATKNDAKIKELESKLEAFKTDDERKAELIAELNRLKGETVSEVVSKPTTETEDKKSE